MLLYSKNSNDHTCDPNDARFARPDNWYPLVSYAGYAQPDPSWLDFPFKAVQADCVRIFAVQLTQDGYGYRYLQLAEIEAYAVSSPALSIADQIQAQSDGKVTVQPLSTPPLNGQKISSLTFSIDYDQSAP